MVVDEGTAKMGFTERCSGGGLVAVVRPTGGSRILEGQKGGIWSDASPTVPDCFKWRNVTVPSKIFY